MSIRHLFAIEVSLLFALIMGCSARVQTKTCKIDTLLVDVSVFPGNQWEETGSRDTRGAPSRLGIERAGTTFSTPTQGGAVNDIYRFQDDAQAKRNYSTLQTDWFNLAPLGSVWISPSELSDVSLNADEYQLNCSRKIIDECWLVSRYKTYVVELEVDMPAVTYSDFIHILQAIDQKMMGCINS
jgi:hypothetical protein